METRRDTPLHLEAVGRAVQDVETRGEDPEIAIRYLENIVNNPDDDKYRRIIKANRKFTSEVWLQPGVRTTFLAIGFREERQGDGLSVIVLDAVTDDCKRCLRLALKRLQGIQRRKLEGGATRDAAGGRGASAAESASLPLQVGGGGSSGGSRRGMFCLACGSGPLHKDTASNRPDVLYRAHRPNLAVTCAICGPDYFVICGQCFNNQSYQHPPEHQLVLYGAAGRLEEQSSWPTRKRDRKPPPPGPGSGGRPRRGPWG